MTINNLRKQKIPTLMVLGALLFTMLGSVKDVSAAVTAAPTGTSILTQNGGTVVTTFSPALGPTITASTTGATAYYGVRVVSSTSSPDVFWEITVSHATSTLAPGMVSITEKGWFDATGNAVADSPYAPIVSGGDLVLSGNSGWSVASGDDFTNVDEISFSALAPTGTYTVTRQLMDTASGTPIDTPYSFMVDLLAAAASSTPDTTAPVFATTTDIMATATTSAGTTVNFVVTATDDTDGSVPVTCVPPSGSNFAVGTTTVICTAMDNASNTATTTFDVIVDLDPEDDGDLDITAPTLNAGLFCSATVPITVSGTATLGSTVTLTGGLATSTATTTGAGTWSTTVDLAPNTSNDIDVTVRDGDGDVIATDTITLNFDNTAPVVTLNGDADMTISENSTFTDLGVTVSDNLDATTTVTTTGSVNTANPGEYTITYTVTDCAGNVTVVTRDVTVESESRGGGGSSRRDSNDDDDDDDTSPATSSVQGGSVDGTTFVSPLNPFNPFQQVLGASSFIPGIPNTGAGGKAPTNIALLLASLGLVAIGTQVLRRRSQETQ